MTVCYDGGDVKVWLAVEDADVGGVGSEAVVEGWHALSHGVECIWRWNRRKRVLAVAMFLWFAGVLGRYGWVMVREGPAPTVGVGTLVGITLLFGLFSGYFTARFGDLAFRAIRRGGGYFWLRATQDEGVKFGLGLRSRPIMRVRREEVEDLRVEWKSLWFGYGEWRIVVVKKSGIRRKQKLISGRSREGLEETCARLRQGVGLG